LSPSLQFLEIAGWRIALASSFAAIHAPGAPPDARHLCHGGVVLDLATAYRESLIPIPFEQGAA